jgi:hypothetical protein
MTISYDNIRVKPVDTFPYAIHFTIAEDNSVVILRVLVIFQRDLVDFRPAVGFLQFPLQGPTNRDHSQNQSQRYDH